MLAAEAEDLIERAGICREAFERLRAIERGALAITPTSRRGKAFIALVCVSELSSQDGDAPAPEAVARARQGVESLARRLSPAAGDALSGYYLRREVAA